MMATEGDQVHASAAGFGSADEQIKSSQSQSSQHLEPLTHEIYVPGRLCILGKIVDDT
jgi:hypothetical protein